ncbi:hypothetical protein MKQ70_18370 [Chitinophaga sedimenti]|uniref:TolB family protein n=1 Tax=Chitinophaga sedimenti TaxID=2033606 RepID=UPI0020045FA4|nr:hypothetical protein [Chitinophaga sedimenti]MCK7556873.1 hypothetical protein [Chitinophaga sedimenti]
MIQPKSLLLLLALPLSAQLQAQQLSVEKIMRDPKWIGTSPSGLFWSSDSKTLYFSWNPDKAPSDSLYYIGTSDRSPRKTIAAARSEVQSTADVTRNSARTQYLYNLSGDIYLRDVKSGKTTRITQTAAYESGERFGFNDRRIVYRSGTDLFAWDISTGLTEQLTRFLAGDKPAAAENKEEGAPAEKWLKAQQLELIDVLASRKEKERRQTLSVKA